MGGKSGTTTSKVSIPPEVMARYNAVNAYSSDVAKTPFQPYQGQFVAGLTPTQQAGIQATSQYSQAAQPYYGAATQQLMSAQQSAMPGISAAYGNVGAAQDIGQQYAQSATGGIGQALQYSQPYMQGATEAAMAGAQQLTPENINIQGYMSPYTQAVADTTYQALRQQQQQEMQGATANAIRAGAFGGDRAGLVAANLARQQQLGTAQAMAPIYQQGYSQALGSAMTAAQANRAALQNLSQQLQGIGQAGYGQQMGAAQQLASLGQQQYGQGLGAAGQLAALAQQGYGMGAGTAQQLAALGSGAQQSALQGAQAQLGAGTLEQQTQQADLTANYQQFLQERGYPFQVAQFLANIAMGTGALSGNTTTTTQPMPFFSDRRVKHDVKEIGKTHDGQPIYSFKYNGDNSTRIGLMAQDVEKKHPEAVYDLDGVKGVDYKEATKDSEREERYAGGLVPASMGGAVTDPGAYGRGGYDVGGGVVDPNDIQALLAAQREAMGPFGEGGIYGQHHAQDTPFGGVKGIVPSSRLHTPRMMRPADTPPLPESGAKQAVQAFDTVMGAKDRYERVKQMLAGEDTPQKKIDEARPDLTTREEVKNLAGPDIKSPSSDEKEGLFGLGFFGLADGGVVPRSRYAVGGMSRDPSLPYEGDDKSPYKYFPTEILETEKPELAKAGQPPAPTSQTGIGVGDVAKLAMKFLLPFADGGAVPRGYLANGGVYDPTMGRMVDATELTPEKIAELNKEDIYSRELQPAAAPRFRSFERIAREEGAKGVVPNELYRSPERSAMLDLTMPEGAPRAKPYGSGHNYRLAVDYSNTTPENYDAIRKAAAATGLTTGLDFKNVDPPHVQLGKGGFGGLYGKDIAIDEGFGQRSHSGVVPPEAIESAYASAREIKPDLPASRATTASLPGDQSEQSSGIMPRMKSFLAENQDWLIPLGAGLKGMVQSRSPFLAGALLEGVGSGLEAVGTAQKQIAEQKLTAATTAATEVEAGKIYERGGRLFVPFRDPKTGQLRNLKSSEYFRLAPKDRPKLSDIDLRRLEEDAKKDTAAPLAPTTEAGAAPTEATPTETTLTKPEGAPPSKPGEVKIQTPGVTPEREFLTVLSPDEMQAMDRAITVAENQPNSAQNVPDKYQQQEDIAGEVRNLEQQMANLGVALSALPPGQSLAASGAAQAVLDPVTKSIDNISRILTGKNLAINPEDMMNKEIVGKAISNLSSMAAAAGNQSAYAALRSMAERFPTLLNSAQGQAALWSELRIVQQRERDKADYFRTLRTYAEQNGDEAIANRTGRDADAMFDAKFKEDMYKKEAEALQRMFRDKVVVNGKTMDYTWLEAMYKTDKLPDSMRSYVAKTYGPNILRYFGS